MNEIWIINGMPGVGKTTVAQALAARYARGVHIEGDRLQELIVSGAVPPGSQPREEEIRQIHLNVRNQCLLARAFCEEGFMPVVDYVVTSRERLEEYRAHLGGVVLRMATLDPGVDVALQRDHGRQKNVAKAWIHLHTEIRAALSGLGLWIDSRHLTVDETVDRIISGHGEALV